MTALVEVPVGGDLLGWMIAATGVLTGIGALVLNRRSQQDQTAQQAAANRIAADRHRLEETQQALDAMEAMVERATTEAERYRIRANGLETDLDEVKSLHRLMFSAQEARCREYAAELTEAVLILRQVVTDEIAAAASETALAQPKHPHEHPGTHRRAEKESDEDADGDQAADRGDH